MHPPERVIETTPSTVQSPGIGLIARTVSSDEERLSYGSFPCLRPSRFAGDKADHLVAVAAGRYLRVGHDYGFIRQVHGVSSACTKSMRARHEGQQ